ncbi:MAG: YkgJ family cysteine cluster protein [Rhodocyclaceae bacterium]|nr:YkgJ family cysteine cluster protein [Rhodocyclaceae bacterium]
MIHSVPEVKTTAVTPCTTCGACCATYRVSFGREELDESPGGCVPAGLIEKIDDKGVCMQGTGSRNPRCVALRGRIGERAECAIYDRRPSPCRAFAREAAFGHGDTSCGDARRLHGLPPLEGSYDAVPLG